MSARQQGLLHPCGTGQLAAMELTSRLLNDERDEDRDGPIGFESKAERARLFAAKMILPLACPAGCPRVGDRGLCRHHRRGLETVRGIRRAGCCRGPSSPRRLLPRPQFAAAEMAAFQTA
jgi:hypothetical protein